MNKYQRCIRGTKLDIYDVLEAYTVTSQAVGHAVKKLLMPGQRGHKDTLSDLKEARVSIERAIQIEEERIQKEVEQPIAEKKLPNFIIKSQGGSLVTHQRFESLSAAEYWVAKLKRNNPLDARIFHIETEVSQVPS